jgi:hypothetical protein
VAVLNFSVNDGGFFVFFDGINVIPNILTYIDDRFSDFDGLSASKQMLKRAIGGFASCSVFWQIRDTLSETAITNGETENLCGRPAHVCELQLVFQVMPMKYVICTHDYTAVSKDPKPLAVGTHGLRNEFGNNPRTFTVYQSLGALVSSIGGDLRCPRLIAHNIHLRNGFSVLAFPIGH